MGVLIFHRSSNSVYYYKCKRKVKTGEALLPWKRCIAELPLRAGSYALRRFIRCSCIYEACMSPALNRSLAMRHFKHSNAIEIRDGITFDFYTGLPHIIDIMPQRSQLNRWTRGATTLLLAVNSHHLLQQ